MSQRQTGAARQDRTQQNRAARLESAQQNLDRRSASSPQRSAGRPSSAAQRPPRRPGTPPRRTVRKKSHIAPLLLALAIVALCVALIVVLVNRGGNDALVNQPTVTAPATGGDADEGNAFADMLAKVDTQEQGALAQGNSVNVTDLSIKQGLDENWLNVLLLGADARVANAPARTDSMIICSINKTTGDVRLASILRDTAVSFEGHKNARINTAYYYGGAKLAMKVVNEYFGMNIQYYAYVDFSGFAAIAEALGGIDVNISENEMIHINKNVLEQYFIGISQGKLNYEESEQEYFATELKTYGTNIHLNGMQTLGFARIRKLDSDFARTERQRTVLNKLMEGMKSSNMFELMNLFTSCSGYFYTNMSMNDILNLANTVLNRTNFALAQQMYLPVNGSYSNEVRNEDAMLYDMNVETNQRELFNFIYR